MPLDLLDDSTWEASTLHTPEGPVTYWVLADWDSFYEQYEDVNNLTRHLIAVSWFDALIFKTYAIGITDRVGSATYFERYTPLQLPNNDGQYLTSLKKKKVHAGTDTFGNPKLHVADPLLGNWPSWDQSGFSTAVPPRIIYEAVFTCPDYEIVTQDALIASGDPRELKRYVTREQQITPKERKVPSFGFETVEATPVPIPEVGFVPFYSVELYYTWRKVPVEYVPGVAIANCLNKINNAAFDYATDGTFTRFQTGTLMFKGFANRLTPYRGPNAEWLVDLPYVFDFQPGDGGSNTWNKVPRNDGSWIQIRVRDTAADPLYHSANFAPLFQPGP